MPRRYSRKKKSNYRRYMNTAQTAVKALKTAQMVASLINVEHKYKFTNAASATIDDDGSVGSYVNGITQGDGAENERVGDSIKLKSFLFKGHLHYGTAPSQNTQAVRIMIIRDQTNIVAGPSDVLEHTGDPYGPYSVIQKDSRNLFKVLADRVYHLNSDSTPVAFKFYLKLNWDTIFNTAASTIGTGDLKLLFISNEPSSSSAAQMPKITLYSQLSYIDN